MRTKIRLTAALTLLSVLLGLWTPAAASQSIRPAVEQSAAFILSTVKAPEVGSVGGEWAVIGLARSGYAVPQSYWDNYYATVEQYVAVKNGVLHKKKYTEYSRVIVALTAIGADPTNVAGYNLLTALGDYEKTIWQGINGPIWALMALDSGNYDVPENPEATVQATRELYLNNILSRQNKDGGWSLYSMGEESVSDPDITGMALQALAKYQHLAEVKTATEKALLCLSGMHDEEGGFHSWGSTNSESVVQTLVALCELGIPVEDPRFVKNGKTLVDNLLSFRNANGSFCHTAEGGSDLMASEQGLYGIVALLRAQTGQSSLYRMEDVTIRVTGIRETAVGLPNKQEDVKKVPVSSPGKTFSDIGGHANQPAIEALAARGILSGMGDGSFAPNKTMTRAEFTAILVNALGLPARTGHSFADVPADAWYASYVATASAYSIVQGRTINHFDPNGTMTRQEAAVMVARAAGLCGMDAELENYEIMNALSQFGDYQTVASWAQESLAFCYDNNILDQNDLDVEPNRPMLRCEIAQMLYNLLETAKLL